MNRFLLAKSFLSIAVAAAFLVAPVSGHFIWIEKDKDSGEVRLFFGEGPVADNHKLLDRIVDAQVWSIADGKQELLSFEKLTTGDVGYLVATSKPDGNEFDAKHVYGVLSRGESKMLLNYCAKYIALTPQSKLARKSKLKLNVIPTLGEDVLSFSVSFRGKPVAGGEFVIIDPDEQTHTLKTDEKGRIDFDQNKSGRYLIRAKHVLNDTLGKHNGEVYETNSFYCTLVLDVMNQANDATKNVSFTATADEDALPNIPVGITSFGGALAGRHLYIYGGNAGGAHGYYKGGQNATLYRLNLDDPKKWESVNTSKGLQGLAMVEHDGKIYRLGGFEARNAKGEDDDLHSVAEFAVFDFEKNDWKQLAPMPSERSSFDAAVVGDVIYVVGGWKIAGEQPKEWHTTAIKFDLSNPKAGWQELPNPTFVRRAMSVAFQGDRLYVIGGMEESNETTRKVAVFDIDAGAWSKGPELPDVGNRMEGFGNSSFNVGGSLIVSTSGGNVYRLNESGSAWEKITDLKNPRFFHRLLPASDNQFVLIGGTDMRRGKAMNVELFSTSNK